MIVDPLYTALLQHTSPHPALFGTVGGSRAYGCASPNSDYDIHGVHLLPARVVLGLTPQCVTAESKAHLPEYLGGEADIATHDLKKFVELLLKSNGNVLEDLYSPIIVHTSPAHEVLRDLGRGCITKRLAAHYKGMAANQQRGITSRPLKSLLHTYRCLLMGIHAMRTGELLFELQHLAYLYHQPQVFELVERKRVGDENLEIQERDSHQPHVLGLVQVLEQETVASSLPDAPAPETQAALEQLVIRMRLETAFGSLSKQEGEI